MELHGASPTRLLRSERELPLSSTTRARHLHKVTMPRSTGALREDEADQTEPLNSDDHAKVVADLQRAPGAGVTADVDNLGQCINNLSLEDAGTHAKSGITCTNLFEDRHGRAGDMTFTNIQWDERDNLSDSGDENISDTDSSESDDALGRPNEKLYHIAPKGPIKRVTHVRSDCPYSKTAIGSHEGIRSRNELVTDGHFLEMVRVDEIEATSGIPVLPETGRSNPLLLDSLDNIFGRKHSGSRLIFKRVTDYGYSWHPADFPLHLDHKSGNIGIQIARRIIPDDCIPPSAELDECMEVFIQMNSGSRKMIRMIARIESSQNELHTPSWYIKNQLVTVQPFQGTSGIKRLLADVTPDDLRYADMEAMSKPPEDLLKCYLPDHRPFYTHYLCEAVRQEQRTNARVFAMTKRLLSDPDRRIRDIVTEKTDDNFTALDYCLIMNAPSIARFLVDTYHVLGVNVNLQNECTGDTRLHLLAKKGDVTANILEDFLSLRFNNGARVFLTHIANRKGQLPIHYAAMNKEFHQRTIGLLEKDWPESITQPSKDGNLPIHYACAMSHDPSLVTFLLHFNQAGVNLPGEDGFTPLHLVASRADTDLACGKLRSLDKETQLRMVKHLLENGADKTAIVHDGNDKYMPVDLISNNDPKQVRELLKVRKHQHPHQGSHQHQDQGGVSLSPLNIIQAPLSNTSSSPSSGFQSELSPDAFDGYPSSSESNTESTLVTNNTEEEFNSSSSGSYSDVEAIVEGLCQNPVLQGVLNRLQAQDGI